MLNKLVPIFKTYLTIINNQKRKNEKLKGNKFLFKANEKEETCIKVKYKVLANFASAKSNAKTIKKSC